MLQFLFENKICYTHICLYIHRGPLEEGGCKNLVKLVISKKKRPGGLGNLLIKEIETDYIFIFFSVYIFSFEICHVHVLPIQTRQMCFSQSPQMGERDPRTLFLLFISNTVQWIAKIYPFFVFISFLRTIKRGTWKAECLL